MFGALTEFAGFYLAGGTALALQIGHRVSVDFDFFSDAPIPRNLLSKVQRVFDDSAIQVLLNNPQQLTVLVDDVKLTFLAYPFPLITPLVPMGGIRLLGVFEIGATKAYSIGRRGTFKDYVDLYFVMKDGYASLRELIASAERKFGGEFNSRLFLEQLLFMDDLADYQIEFLHQTITPAEILNFFQDAVLHFSLNQAA
jgi:hypothetical protein